MKCKLMMLIMLSIFFSESKSQEKNNEVQTLFGNGGKVGGFITTAAKAGEVNEQLGLFVGGGISAVFSSRLNIGFVGYGLVTDVDADTYLINNEVYKLDVGYGGLLFEPVIAHKKLIHLSLPVVLGAGGSGLRLNSYHGRAWERDDLKHFDYDRIDFFLVAEPGVNIEVNILKNVRFNVGASYRKVYDSQLEGISDEELSGFAGSLGFKFGWF